MKVLIVDDHPLFLVGLRHIFTAASHDIELLEATNFADALELIIQDQDIDWLCLDLQIPGGNGIGFIERLRNRGITLPVAILTAEEDPKIIDRALEAGAIAYLTKSSSKSELIAGIVQISAGQSVISPSLINSLRDYQKHKGQHAQETIKLTRRQKEILKLVSDGLSNRDIGNKLHLAESTVKGHVSALYDLLGVSNRAACTNLAFKHRLID